MVSDPTELHEETGVFDAHADLLYAASSEHRLGNDTVIADEFLPEMREGNIDMRVLPIYLDANNSSEPATRYGFRIAEVFRKEVATTAELEVARTAEDIAQGTDNDNFTLVLGMEGVEPLTGDLYVLDVFYRLGLRVLGLTHSRRNAAADGVFFEPTRSGEPGGLSSFGVAVIERCQEHGIVVDVSHLNETGFWDVVEYMEQPFIASHSNCRELHDHPRNLWDEQLKAVADANGVVGINALRAFLGEDDITVETMVDHIEHIIEVAGIDAVGLGLDFYDYNLEYMTPAEKEYMIDVSTADGLDTDREVVNITAELVDRGYAEDEIKRILKGNFVRVLESVLPER